MAVTQYIGARYVPLFSDPLEWDVTKEYEPLTIVYWQGNSYTSRQAVPSGVDIANDSYWALTGNYNAQIEQYRKEVRQYDERIASNAREIGSLDARMDSAESTLEALGTAAKKNWTNQITSKGADLPTAGAVYSELSRDTSTFLKAGAYTDVSSTVASGSSSVPTGGAVYSAIQEASAAAAKRGTYIGIVGDSFSDEETPTGESRAEWPTILKSYTGYSYINKAVSGTGWVTGNKTFLQQFEELTKDPNWINCEYVIIYGGLNDFAVSNASVTVMQNAFAQFVNTYTGLSHKPKLIIAVGNCGTAYDARWNRYSLWVNQCNEILRDLRLPCVDNVYQWLMEDNSANFIEDGTHPNKKGCSRIASYMASLINGTYNGVHFQTASSVTGGGYITVKFDNGIVSIMGKNVSLSSWTANPGILFNNVKGSAYSIGSNLNTYPANATVSHAISNGEIVFNPYNGYVMVNKNGSGELPANVSFAFLAPTI